MPQDQFFTRTWPVYERILEGDYLEHRAFYETVRELLAAEPPASILELGCGDARFTAPLLRDLGVREYLGVDLSEVALAEAREHLGPNPAWRLEQGDALQAVLRPGPAWDLVFASFCLHHLTSAEKARLVGALPGRRFVLLDLFREDGEGREAYLERRHRWIREGWTRLSPEQVQEVLDHELACDFPETAGFYRGAALAAGFSTCVEHRVDARRMGRLLSWSR